MPDVEVGQQAPEFTLKDESFKDVSPSALRGTPVVLVFYPADFSPGCTTEMCALRDDYSLFEEKGARVFGISRDGIFAHRAFKEKEGLPQSLLADTNGDVARLYGAWNEAFSIADRMTVVIDKDGKITYVEHNGPAQLRDLKQALAALG